MFTITLFPLTTFEQKVDESYINIKDKNIFLTCYQKKL